MGKKWRNLAEKKSKFHKKSFFRGFLFSSKNSFWSTHKIFWCLIKSEISVISKFKVKKKWNYELQKNHFPWGGQNSRTLLMFGNASKRARTCSNTQQVQVCAPKGTRNRSQNPTALQWWPSNAKKFKTLKFSIVCLCVYILTTGWEMCSTDVLDPKELTKRFGDGSHMFQGHFRTVGFSTLENHWNSP